MFLRLKAINDSLLTATVDLKGLNAKKAAFKPLTEKEAELFIEKTTVVEEQKSRRKLLGRLRDAFSNKAPKPVSTVTTVQKVQDEAGLDNELSLKALNDLFRSSLAKIQSQRAAVKETEKQLLLSNDRLLSSLSSVLKDFKQLETEVKGLREVELSKNAQVSIKQFSTITLAIIVLSVVLALVILINAWQLYKHDQKLVAARNEAVRQTHLRGDFLAHMSHEIRTPLNSILGFSEQLESSSLNGTQKEQVAALRHSSRILLSIVNDVLDLSKFDTGNVNLHTTNFYPEKTINHVVSSLQIRAGKKKLLLTCECDMDSQIRLAGDEYRLKQVLINLINNAIKFTDSGVVKVYATVEGTNLSVDISDTGQGIPKEELKNIFNEFTQINKATDRERHNGSGLGLAICKKIVEAQGGNVEVKSEPGKGSVFSFTIPYSPFQPGLETEIRKDLPSGIDTATLLSRTILVAEDDKMNIMLISTILNKWGISYDIAESGKQAFELFKQKSYDMVLTDINMPDGDGIWLTRSIRDYADQAKSGIPVLAITANAVQQDLEEYTQIGMDDHITKPFTEQKLFDKISRNMSPVLPVEV